MDSFDRNVDSKVACLLVDGFGALMHGIYFPARDREPADIEL